MWLANTVHLHCLVLRNSAFILNFQNLFIQNMTWFLFRIPSRYPSSADGCPTKHRIVASSLGQLKVFIVFLVETLESADGHPTKCRTVAASSSAPFSCFFHSFSDTTGVKSLLTYPLAVNYLSWTQLRIGRRKVHSYHPTRCRAVGASP